MSTLNEATVWCEAWLEKSKAYNEANNCFFTETKIINLLLSRKIEMTDVYAAICELPLEQQRGEALQVIIDTAFAWKPEDAKKYRQVKKRLEDINELIADHARQLSGLIMERSDLADRYGFSCGTTSHIHDHIECAGLENGHFDSYLKEKLCRLRYQYELKYWPRVEQVVQSIAEDASNADVQALDEVTQASISSPRASQTDFFRALFQRLENAKRPFGACLPRKFMFKDSVLAALANCVLDIPAEKLLGAEDVKSIRQRIRNQQRV